MSDCLSPKGEFPKCTEGDRAWRKEFSPGALLWVTFLGHARKVTESACPVVEQDGPYFMKEAQQVL